VIILSLKYYVQPSGSDGKLRKRAKKARSTKAYVKTLLEGEFFIIKIFLWCVGQKGQGTSLSNSIQEKKELNNNSIYIFLGEFELRTLCL
jgi:hypothetical protein